MCSADCFFPFKVALIFARVSIGCLFPKLATLSLARVSNDGDPLLIAAAFSLARYSGEKTFCFCQALIFARASTDAFLPMFIARIRNTCSGERTFPLLAALSFALVSVDFTLPVLAILFFSLLSAECFLPVFMRRSCSFCPTDNGLPILLSRPKRRASFCFSDSLPFMLTRSEKLHPKLLSAAGRKLYPLLGSAACNLSIHACSDAIKSRASATVSRATKSKECSL